VTGVTNVLEGNLSHCHSVQHKSHMDSHGNETGMLEVTCYMWKDGQ